MNTTTGETTARPIHAFTLDNGLTIVVREDPRKPEFCSTLLYRVNKSQEHPEERGINGVIRNAILIDYDEDRKTVKEIGGDFSTKGGNTFNLRVQLPKEHLETAFKFQSKTMTSQPDDAELRDWLAVAISRYKENDSHPWAEHYSPEYMALVHTGKSGYQTAKDITTRLEQMTLEQIRQWHKTWYGPDNAILTIAGDVDPAEVKRLAEKYYGGIARGHAPERPHFQLVEGNSPPGHRRITQRRKVQSPLILIDFNIPRTLWADTKIVRALNIISALLSHSIPQSLKTTGPDPMTIQSYLSTSQGSTRLAFLYGFEGDPDDAEAYFWRMLQKLTSTPLSQSEIDGPLRTARGNRKSDDSLMAQSTDLANWINNGHPLHLFGLQKSDQLQALTPTDVLRAAQTCLVHEQVTVGHIFPLLS